LACAELWIEQRESIRGEQFCGGKGRGAGAYELAAGTALRLRYRVILHAGALDVAARYDGFRKEKA